MIFSNQSFHVEVFWILIYLPPVSIINGWYIYRGSLILELHSLILSQFRGTLNFVIFYPLSISSLEPGQKEFTSQPKQSLKFLQIGQDNHGMPQSNDNPKIIWCFPKEGSIYVQHPAPDFKDNPIKKIQLAAYRF